jgi:hypothetical protein
MTLKEYQDLKKLNAKLTDLLNSPDAITDLPQGMSDMWQNAVEETIEQIALHLFPICPNCGERHPPSDQMEIKEKAKKISEIILKHYKNFPSH